MGDSSGSLCWLMPVIRPAAMGCCRDEEAARSCERAPAGVHSCGPGEPVSISLPQECSGWAPRHPPDPQRPVSSLPENWGNNQECFYLLAPSCGSGLGTGGAALLPPLNLDKVSAGCFQNLFCLSVYLFVDTVTQGPVRHAPYLIT